MDKEKTLPKGLYDIVSELVTFIDRSDLERKEKNTEKPKDLILNVDKSSNGLIK